MAEPYIRTASRLSLVANDTAMQTCVAVSLRAGRLRALLAVDCRCHRRVGCVSCGMGRAASAPCCRKRRHHCKRLGVRAASVAGMPSSAAARRTPRWRPHPPLGFNKVEPAPCLAIAKMFLQ